jgi:hypothetical protein
VPKKSERTSLTHPYQDSLAAKLIQRRVRELKDFRTQREIAAQAGFPIPNALSMIKRGCTAVPPAKARAIARALDVDPDEFVRICVQSYPNTRGWGALVEGKIIEGVGAPK